MQYFTPIQVDYIGDGPETVGDSLPFKSVKVQDLVQLRRAIEGGNVEAIKSLVDSNPRYLVASGDTPTMLQVIRQLIYKPSAPPP